MKKYYYELSYTYNDDKANEHSFQIGYFSSLKFVERAIETVKNKPGFKECLGCFEYSKIAVYFEPEAAEKYSGILYELSHEYTDNEGYDNWVIFGVFSTLEDANRCKQKNAKRKPYCYHLDGFCIAPLKVDVCGWTEGFVHY